MRIGADSAVRLVPPGPPPPHPASPVLRKQQEELATRSPERGADVKPHPAVDQGPRTQPAPQAQKPQPAPKQAAPQANAQKAGAPQSPPPARTKSIDVRV